MPRPTRSKVATTTGASALDALRARRDAHKNEQSPAALATTKPTRLTAQKVEKRTKTPTPEATRQGDSDEDLYGLSPTGERSQLLAARQTQAKRQPDFRQSVSVQMQGTPAAVAEASVLPLANFKRRARQPSILSVTSRRASPEAGGEDSADVEGLDDFEDIETFAPEDESTPFELKTRTRLSRGAKSDATLRLDSRDVRSSSSRKRKRSPVVQVLSSSSSSRADDVQVPASSPPPADFGFRDEEDVARSNPSSLPELVVDTREGPDYDSETMAPPRSSSPVKEDGVVGRRSTTAPAKGRGERRNRTRRLAAEDDVSEGEDGEVATITPAAAVRSKGSNANRNAKKQPEHRVLKTADLQSLLPQRRRRTTRAAPDTFDIPSSSEAERERGATELGSDDDELGARSARTARARRGVTATRTPRSIAKNGTKKTSRSMKSKTATAKSSVAAKAKLTVSRTYSRRSSDKENAPQNDENRNNASTYSIGADNDGAGSSSAAEFDDDVIVVGGVVKGAITGNNRGRGKRVVSAELEAAADKFREVDEWEMEFESVSGNLGGGSSSPWR